MHAEAAKIIKRQMDQFEMLFNLGEAALWAIIAMGMGIAAVRRNGKRRRLLATAAISFAVFGFSDWIEAKTGSWWEPWWLLAMKVACVAVLILTLRAWSQMRAREEG